MKGNLLSLVVMLSTVSAGACAVDQPGDVSGEGGGSGGSGSDDGGGNGCIEGPCTQDPTMDGGMGSGSADPSSPIDTACTGDQPVEADQLLVPKWTPLAPTVPANCLVGFEMNRLEQYTHTMQSAAGSRAITLEVDIATYTASDAIRISAVDGNGNETILVDTCRMRTAEYADPTGGTTRPPEDSIRDFRVNLPAGTKQLVVDNTNASTPTYIRVLGLCDFNLQPPPTTALTAGWFRVVTSR